MKTAAQRQFFIAERNTDNKNSYGRRPEKNITKNSGSVRRRLKISTPARRSWPMCKKIAMAVHRRIIIISGWATIVFIIKSFYIIIFL